MLWIPVRPLLRSGLTVAHQYRVIDYECGYAMVFAWDADTKYLLLRPVDEFEEIDDGSDIRNVSAAQ